MRHLSAILLALLPLPLSGAAFGQTLASPDAGIAAPRTTGSVIETQPNTTGNMRDVVISRGATGAETITTDSAAGGNARLPERAVPNGSAGGNGSGGGG